MKKHDTLGKLIPALADPNDTRPADNVVGFNYESIPDEAIRADVQDRATAIHTLQIKMADAAVQIGKHLLAVKERMPGQFRAWVKAEFRWKSYSLALQMMNAARRFGHLECLEKFQPSALYVLGRETTPDAARDEAVALARSGETVNFSSAVEMKERHLEAQAAESRNGADAPPPSAPRNRGDMRRRLQMVVRAMARTWPASDRQGLELEIREATRRVLDEVMGKPSKASKAAAREIKPDGTEAIGVLIPDQVA